MVVDFNQCNLSTNVVPSAPPTKRGRNVAFCSENSQPQDVFTKQSGEKHAKKDSFLYRNRDLIGFFGFSFLGDLAAMKAFPKFFKEAGVLKQSLVSIPLCILTGTIGSYITTKVWNHNNHTQ